MFSGKNCCVATVVGSNNMWKAKIMRLKLDLVRIFLVFLKYFTYSSVRMSNAPVTSVSYGTSPPLFWRENLNI
jgi:hypothetical protein